MEPKEIRKKILETINNSENPRDFNIDDSFIYQKTLIGSKLLDREIRYLEEKGYLKILDEAMDGYNRLAITSAGIDFIENPDTHVNASPVEIYQFQNMTGGNISVKSPSSTQSISKHQDINPEVLNLLKELLNSIENKDEKKSLTTLKKIGNISKEILMSIVSNGIYEFIKRLGTEI